MCAQYKKESKKNIFNNRTDDNQTKFGEEEEFSSNYLDIWEINPSYKDINLKISLIKAISLSLLVLLFSFYTYLLTHSLYIALDLIIFTLIFFMLAFSDNFFSFRNLWSFFFQRVTSINPFKNLAFWKISEDPETIIIVNKKDSISVAIRIFRIESLPENVYPTLNQFLKALNKVQIQYTYQVAQNPLFEFSKSSFENKDQIEFTRNQILNSIESSQTSIYFCVYHQLSGLLTNTRMAELIETVQDFSNEFKSNFSANFHHTKISLLAGNDSINGIRTFFSKDSNFSTYKEADHFITKENPSKLILKTIFTSWIIGYISFLLLSYKIPLLFVIIINFLVMFSIFFIWWRDIIYYISKSRLFRSMEIISINPFKDVKFYYSNRLNDVVFSYIDNQLLLASKIYNLKFAKQPTLTYFDKFIRGIGNHKIAFNYNLQATPILSELFSKECLKFLNDRTYESLEGILYTKLDEPPSRKVKYPEVEFEKWLDMRSGIWKTMLTLSTTSYLFTNDLKLKNLIELERELSTHSKVLKSTFESNFLNFKLIELKNQQLISGFLSECLKSHDFRLNGSHLNYIYFQGKSLIELAKIANEFKKGIDTRIAAEFNTPLQLKNFITIGQTINTEFLEEEVPLGFTFEQIKQLLITNGIPSSREYAKMKIVSELVKSNIPCVIFDFTGKWSKLIHYFRDTTFKDHILHFKLGSSFSIDIKNSGMKYDQNNIEYLNLFYDVFALAFKEHKRNIDILKETISKSDELDLSSITLDLQVKQKLNKPFYSNSLLLLFKDFTDQNQIFSKTALEFEDDINPIDFLKNNKTIIIDLSILKDLEKKIFVAFVILSKFIHLIENSEDYYKKIIVIPHVDLFFDSYYIDTNSGTVNYGKIDKFIAPLLQREFGLIFSANQIRYLHPHVFNYFQNVITFRANDTRDLAVLKNKMNLQELHGTGYYSSKRNNTYQIDYLMNMQNDEIIVKRSDIYQPFPGKISYGNLIQAPHLTQDQIMDYMEKQGYKLQISERKLLGRTRKTIFEKDFGIYASFIDEIIHFLKTISSIDNVGNLYKHKLKSELLKYIGPKATKKVQSNAQIKEIRDELFDILVKHGYLVENHPKRASGSETIRTSYAVGPQYQEALKDYFEAKENVTEDISVDIIEKNIPKDSKILNMSQETTSNISIDREKFQEVLNTQNSEVLWKLFQMYSYNEEKDFLNSLKIGKNIISDFLINLHKAYLQESDSSIPEINDLSSFLDYLTENELLPFSTKELQHYLRKNKEISADNGNIEKNGSELYDLISKFQRKLNNFHIN